MFLKSLSIKNKTEVIRFIEFHKGLNLIIDETHTDKLQETGNNVGKTTVIRLIDYCLGGSGNNIYQDPEFKGKTNTQIETFLKQKNIVITLTLKENLDEIKSQEILIRRNFLKRKDKIQEINGEQYNNDRDFDAQLKELIFKTIVVKPTLRQIIAKNIRDEKSRLVNTLKVLHFNTTIEEYEALYFFWFGIETNTADRKQKLYELKKTETKAIDRLKRDSTLSEIEQALKIIDRDITQLNQKKKDFNINEKYEEDIVEINSIRAHLNQISSEIGRLNIRKQLIAESQTDLEKEYSTIDMAQLESMYLAAKIFMPDLQAEFNELIKFHNNMLKERVKYIIKELPELEEKLIYLHGELLRQSAKEKELTIKVNKSGMIEELEGIIQKLNQKYELKGMYEEQLRQWNCTLKNLEVIEEELDKINQGIDTLDAELNEKIQNFNFYFTKLSDRLYNEQFILSYDKTDRAYIFKIGSIGGNLGTGKKKGQIAAFDFAYIEFCENNDIPCLHFIIHDQIENIHDNQIKILSEVANEIDCQFIAPVLRDKLPPELDVSKYKVLSLSQDDKLFRI